MRSTLSLTMEMAEQKAKNDLDKEIKERRAEVQKYEKRVLAKEETLDRKAEMMEKKEAGLSAKEATLEKQREDVEEAHGKMLQELERISGLTSEQAKDFLLKQVEDDVKHELLHGKAAIQLKEDVKAKGILMDQRLGRIQLTEDEVEELSNECLEIQTEAALEAQRRDQLVDEVVVLTKKKSFLETTLRGLEKTVEYFKKTVLPIQKFVDKLANIRLWKGHSALDELLDNDAPAYNALKELEEMDER